MASLSFDEMVKINESAMTGDPRNYSGVEPVNGGMWHSMLTDLALSLFTWKGDFGFFDLLQIEKFIHNRTTFCAVRTKYKTDKAIVSGGVKIMACTPEKHGFRNEVVKIRLTETNLPDKLVRTYEKNDFVLFRNYSHTFPTIVTAKYAEMLAKLDALYMQNVDKLGVPIIAVTNKSMYNELLNLFKRTKLNALFSMISGERGNVKATELFYNPDIKFMLADIKGQMTAVMHEFLQECGVNPRQEVMENSQYVNQKAVVEGSLIAKYFAASLNKYRDCFCEEVKERLGKELSYETTVQPEIDAINMINGGVKGEGDIVS